MAQDHYVAQTYLKHWADPGTGMLRGYNKRVDKQFPCYPKDVCREWNWDISPLFKDNPKALADFRKIFEPHWNPTIGAVRAGPLTSDEKFVLAGYWALLTTCTPAWHQHAVELYGRQLRDFIPIVAQRVAERHPEHRESLDKVLAEGRIALDVDQDYVKGILTKHLTAASVVFYEQDWIILENTTEMHFITSDNPSSIIPGRSLNSLLIRFLPLSPDLAIMTAMDRAKIRRAADQIPDLSELRPGKIQRARINRKKAMELNRVVAMNADQIIFSSKEERRVRRIVRSHRNFGIATDHVKIPTLGGGYISGSTLVVRQRGR
jgi:hypothetical protein